LRGPHAWIVADQPVDPAELAAWCREYLAPYKVPAGFTRTNALPRSDIGKLPRRELPARGETVQYNLFQIRYL
jgi:acyl-CoA synthetase (AMP-forming)/AMP-acid ligase II